MDRPQLIRRLRITTSVFFAVVTVVLCVLWVRSYWFGGNWGIQLPQRTIMINVARGHVGVSVDHADNQSWRFIFDPYEITDGIKADIAAVTTFGFGYLSEPKATVLIFPIWTAVVFSALAVWVASRGTPKRNSLQFSLRTLLIVTTLVAVVLGLGVWLAS